MHACTLHYLLLSSLLITAALSMDEDTYSHRPDTLPEINLMPNTHFRRTTTTRHPKLQPSRAHFRDFTLPFPRRHHHPHTEIPFGTDSFFDDVSSESGDYEKSTNTYTALVRTSTEGTARPCSVETANRNEQLSSVAFDAKLQPCFLFVTAVSMFIVAIFSFSPLLHLDVW